VSRKLSHERGRQQISLRCSGADTFRRRDKRRSVPSKRAPRRRALPATPELPTLPVERRRHPRGRGQRLRRGLDAVPHASHQSRRQRLPAAGRPPGSPRSTLLNSRLEAGTTGSRRLSLRSESEIPLKRRQQFFRPFLSGDLFGLPACEFTIKHCRRPAEPDIE
jgi:hypothetical protein